MLDLQHALIARPVRATVLLKEKHGSQRQSIDRALNLSPTTGRSAPIDRSGNLWHVCSTRCDVQTTECEVIRDSEVDVGLTFCDFRMQRRQKDGEKERVRASFRVSLIFVRSQLLIVREDEL